ncbi:hypothetical protein LZ32DRAFT_306820 [Colletotrichum eremochloae]|nr:hypothetical protein LZ32DRAFT_306820 [Colletotrichum eremochloae]
MKTSAQLQLGFSMASNQLLVSHFLLPVMHDFDRIHDNPSLAWAEAHAFFRDYKNPRQLGWKTLNIDTPRPELPNASQIVFASETARILAMQMSSYEELEIDLINAAELESFEFNALFLPDVTSAWSAEKRRPQPYQCQMNGVSRSRFRLDLCDGFSLHYEIIVEFDVP